MSHPDSPPRTPRCVASTAPTEHTANSFFKSAQWSPDGTTLLANNEDNTLRTYLSSPPTLLTSTTPHALHPYTILPLPTPTTTTTFYPHHNLSDVSSTLYLASLPDHPIRLQNSLHSSLVASYPLIHAPTERYITPASLQFIHNGASFLAGADGEIACFEIERVGQGPVERRALKGGKQRQSGKKGGMDMTNMGSGMKGIVSALSVSSEGILAAGTFSRNVGIFADEGLGDCITVFSLNNNNNNNNNKSSSAHGQPSTQQEKDSFSSGGTGITHLQWSPCGRYLYIAERQSSSIQIYDIRVLGRRLGCLTGRRAKTNQRVGFEVVEGFEGAPAGMQTQLHSAPQERGREQEQEQDRERGGADGCFYEIQRAEAGRMEGGGHHNIWSGGTDGVVRVWENPHFISEETLPPTEGLGWKAHHDDTIASTTFHPTTAVIATCSGQRDFSLPLPTTTCAAAAALRKSRMRTATKRPSTIATGIIFSNDGDGGNDGNDGNDDGSSDEDVDVDSTTSTSSSSSDDEGEENQKEDNTSTDSSTTSTPNPSPGGDFSLKVWSFH